MKYLITVLAIVFAVSAQAQNKFKRSTEIGIAVGTSYYLGELNPYTHFGTTLRPGGALMYRHSSNRRWSVKAALSYAMLEAYDSNSDVEWQQNRNLHFRNNIFEGSVVAELNFWDYQPGNQNYHFSPYFFGGLGFYSMGPLAKFNGDWYELQPLGTEGQGTSQGGQKYAQSGVVVPFGVGLKASISGRFSIGIEWGMRKTYTDYLDDVGGTYADPSVLLEESGRLAQLLGDPSLEQPDRDGGNFLFQRGDSSRRDWYNMTHLTLMIRIDKRATTCWK